MAEESHQDAGPASSPSPEAAPPQLNDAIQALQAQQAEILREVRGSDDAEPADVGEEEPDGELAEGDEYDEGAEGEPDWSAIPDEMSEGDFRTAVRDEAIAAIKPYALATEKRRLREENQRREEAIHALAERYPQLQEEPVITAVADSLRELARRTGDATVQTDPWFVRQAYLAYAAEQAAAGETPADAGGRGATLESGAGPGLQEQEVDPVQQQYERAILGEPGRDVLTS